MRTLGAVLARKAEHPNQAFTIKSTKYTIDRIAVRSKSGNKIFHGVTDLLLITGLESGRRIFEGLKAQVAVYCHIGQGQESDLHFK